MKRMIITPAALAVTQAATVLSCAAPQRPVHEQTADVRVEKDDLGPIEGASVLVDGHVVARTNNGHAQVRLRGAAGDRFAVTTTCPEGTRGSEDGQEVFVTPGVAPKLVFRCEQVSRSALVVVRAENGANLPVRLLGREVGRTDASGAATILVNADEGESFELVLDTTSAPKLHPQSPALTFRATERDQTFVFDQKFRKDKPLVRRAAPPPVPIHIGG